MAFNENTRVQIPALIHLTRLGYTYIPQRQRAIDHSIDEQTNIITDIFINRLKSLNPDADPVAIEQEIKNIQDELGYDDLGRSFYNRLLGNGDSSLTLIDWENFGKNKFHVTTELACRNGEDEFRPDITVFINGLPLSFIEVKKPNNHEGIKAERDRINARFKNEKFRSLSTPRSSSCFQTTWSTTMSTRTN